jgi:competence protein ComEA
LTGAGGLAYSAATFVVEGAPQLLDALERYRWVVVVLLAVPLAVGIGVLIGERTGDPQPLVIEPGKPAPGELQVYVTGAVVSPGVYPLEEGSRWIDALEAAGGASADADLTRVNLAKRAVDQDQIVVPRIGEAPPAVAGTSQAPDALVNINTASQADLESLPGIGEIRAQSIIQSRTVDGAFVQPEDLVLRDLVPPSVFEQIAALVVVE